MLVNIYVVPVSISTMYNRDKVLRKFMTPSRQVYGMSKAIDFFGPVPQSGQYLILIAKYKIAK